ncbi:venom carboxylesterase-6-like [Photinus pyralis]|uniref:venom carboxylesterase-6-like n=1 Tax=Photinus pyralis TaxID=7054 RepID=UPI001266E9E6|nr:venom carboxylesterase-6-like [Photinus pyralis]
MRLLVVLLHITYLLAFESRAPLVRTSLGNIRGYHKYSLEGRRFSAFEGIPYGQPPVGDFRFEAPRNVLPWNTTLDARTLFVCSQVKNSFFADKPDQEDCLYLNVYVPKEQPSENDKFDVVVKIHGGSFTYGDGSVASPGFIMDRDLVYVNLNYRLGPLGFLSTGDNIVPGNNGLKDQQLALQWVQTHIKQFGGNPNSVTLMGQSAGGVSVHFHYFSPKSRGLFHRGLSQSGTVLLPWAIQAGPLKGAQTLAASLNCENSDTRMMIACLKHVPVHDLLSKAKNLFRLNTLPLAPFAPVVEVESDTAFMTKHPYLQLLSGEVYDVPWLAWRTSDEGIFLGVLAPPAPYDEIEKHWDEWAPCVFNYDFTVADSQKTAVAHKIKSYYFQNETVSHRNVKKFSDLMGDRYFNVGFEEAIAMQANLGKSPVYAGIYCFNKTNGLAKGSGVDGVTHGDDNLLLHDDKPIRDIRLSTPETDIKNFLLDILSSYAKNGKPEATGINWEPVAQGKFNYLLMCDADDSHMVEKVEFGAEQFWESLDIKENGPDFPPTPNKKSDANRYEQNLNLPSVTLYFFFMLFQ